MRRCNWCHNRVVRQTNVVIYRERQRTSAFCACQQVLLRLVYRDNSPRHLTSHTMTQHTLSFSSVLAVCVCTLMTLTSAAQTPLSFRPYDRPDCRTVQTVRSTAEFDWIFAGACGTVVLAHDNETLQLDGIVDLPTSTLSGYNFSDGGNLIPVPGNAGDYYHLEIWVTGADSAMINEDKSFVEMEDQSPAGYGMRLALGKAGNACGGSYLGGSAVRLSRLYLGFTRGVPRSIAIGFAYKFTRIEVSSVLAEVTVMDSEFTGTEYVHTLPGGTVILDPGRAAFTVGFNDLKDEVQTIKLTKTGGTLAAPNYVFIAPAVTSSGKPHLLSLELMDVEMCLPSNGEIMIGNGASLTLSGVHINYGGRVACLGVWDKGVLRVARGRTQIFGESGYGMQAFEEGSTTILEEDASLVLDIGISAPLVAYRSVIEVAAGARLEVTKNATYLGGKRRSIRVKLQPGATFDASAAPQQVQEIFDVISVVSAPEALDAERFSVYPNPASSGESITVARVGAFDAPIMSLELYDALGRRVRREVVSQAVGSQDFRYTLAHPGAGLYTLRLTDAEGRVGNLRLIGQ